ncbi:ErfK/YbiS/YcfS/YnhG family protein [Hyphomicrobium denitrificans 1NES1]|uniref:ErfK/YbiS/YcfS/YnhG family protein n=1 Tax=Hyphomicrobium denitrificans 1NES1 TaxID=670307 RepID=N0BH84_9HYPH|nr:murein L,D-transpeptidase family protein [Hyphomicrobium denitrificans]AGK59485.1 ErfK/YbiS/YcfS/YnhG family protein [Hyphomicrobium denitrificans 1NES1]
MLLSFQGLLRVTILAALAFAFAGIETARALTIELKDVAADRVERQRAAAAGALPLPGTPNVAFLQERLRDKGVTLADPILIRIFKAESELEIWKQKGDAYVLFATYPICHWSGTLGPKMRDGDRQAPEGYYTLTRSQTRHVGRWPRSLDLGFPNLLDQSQARTGSSILIHGGCSSIGCFAMTNPVSDEIHQLTVAAMDGGEQIVPVHVFPFRMTDKNLSAQISSPWKAFWTNLKDGYDLFDRTKRPPIISVCGGRYIFREAQARESSGPLEACGPTLTAIREQDQWLQDVPYPTPLVPRLAAQSTETTRPIPQLQSSLDSEAPAVPTFSWPLIR